MQSPSLPLPEWEPDRYYWCPACRLGLVLLVGPSAVRCPVPGCAWDLIVLDYRRMRPWRPTPARLCALRRLAAPQVDIGLCARTAVLPQGSRILPLLVHAAPQAAPKQERERRGGEAKRHARFLRRAPPELLPLGTHRSRAPWMAM